MDPILVIGDGWASLGAVISLVMQSSSEKVVWMSGSKTKLFDSVSGTTPRAVRRIEAWASELGLEVGSENEGALIRQYRNKAFQKCRLTQEKLWEPEKQWITQCQMTLGVSFPEVEVLLRKALLQKFPHQVQCEQYVPLESVHFDKKESESIQVEFASGKICSFRKVYYSDRFGHLARVEGLGKPHHLTRGRNAYGLLQAEFHHHPKMAPLTQGLYETFCAPSYKDSGENFERHVWGYFLNQGKKSLWTMALNSKEVEDNHSIAKKFRRLKSTLDRVFQGSGLVPERFETFAETIQSERVCFEEEGIFGRGDPLLGSIRIPKIPEFHVLTDAYGLAGALDQIEGEFYRNSPISSEAETSSEKSRDSHSPIEAEVSSEEGLMPTQGAEGAESSEAST